MALLGRSILRRAGQLLFGIALILISGQAGAKPAQKSTAQVKAAIIYNVCKFVEWPETTFDRDLFSIGILGDTDNLPDFNSLKGKSIAGRPIALRNVKSRDDLEGCSLLYVAGTDCDTWRSLIGDGIEFHILTLSECDGFAKDGGMIQLTRRGKRTGFEINRAAVDASGFQLSSQLLRMATIVEVEP